MPRQPHKCINNLASDLFIILTARHIIHIALCCLWLPSNSPCPSTLEGHTVQSYLPGLNEVPCASSGSGVQVVSHGTLSSSVLSVSVGTSTECISNLVNCAQLEDLPELPAHDEERLQRASQLLQQRLILRQWLGQHNLQHHYQRTAEMTREQARIPENRQDDPITGEDTREQARIPENKRDDPRTGEMTRTQARIPENRRDDPNTDDAIGLPGSS
ncbi:unnamed protein product [Timema podura]|uniref:Uncharacterized protein n=1 Tax=Timema podura TaxID=61482 RepID=A0ABN7NCA7_TIMPD|nr:unnamed protein product [Timema podura]